ncbi:MAG: selenide, water dikinase SelD [Nitrosomonadales bacterium]|nr:selenide, water dikinase SelD [Nitrosomonadales bacterium]
MSVRLTELSHGGGCGCKIDPAALRDMLAALPQAGVPLAQAFPDLLVGIESGDDAAVYRLNDEQAIVATTDFFMPIVDDAFDFGRIAATNALSDVYAMGGKPILALAIVGMPINTLPLETIQKILAGGAAVCAQAGIPVAGGHSIDAPEPIYGLVALGVVHPQQVKRNNQARDGDVLILAKGLGVGILSTALKKQKLDADGYAEMLHSTTQLNTPGGWLAGMGSVHAMTDVTGFGLLGHLLGICRGSQLAAEVGFARLPLLHSARQLAQQGFVTGASKLNWQSYGDEVELAPDLAEWQRNLLTDPQTSGGLLIACGSDAAQGIVQRLHSEGFTHAAIIGQLRAGAARVLVR